MLCLNIRLHIRIVHGVCLLAQRAGQRVSLLGLDFVPVLTCSVHGCRLSSSGVRELLFQVGFLIGDLPLRQAGVPCCFRVLLLEMVPQRRERGVVQAVLLSGVEIDMVAMDYGLSAA